MKIKSLMISIILVSLLSISTGCKKDEDNGILGWALGLTMLQDNTTTTTTTTTPETNLRIFFTSSTWTGGNLGGIAGADAKCNSDANKPADGSTYKALIVGTTRRACSTANCSGGVSENIDWVLKPDRDYYRLNGTTKIGTTNSAGIFTFNVLTGVTDDGTGATMDPGSWTGLNTDWTNHTGTCTDWGATTGTGACGFTAPNTSSMISDGGLTLCSGSQNLFCVEQ